MKQIKSALIKFFKSFTLYEILFLTISLTAVTTTSILVNSDGLSIAFSIIAIIAVFVLAKGVFIAPIYQIVMCAVYSAQAYLNGLYGEMILNLAILVPLQIYTMINWAMNKKSNSEIQINSLKWQEWLSIFVCAIVLIVPVYFMLNALNTNYLYISIFTFIIPIVSYYLSLRRSIYQFVSFIVQNLVLIALWLMPVFEGQPGGIELLPMALTFVAFVINNIYGLINWTRKHKEQILVKENKKKLKDKIITVEKCLKRQIKFNRLSDKNCLLILHNIKGE